MTAVVLFFAVGLLLLVVEVIAPGGILGVFGALFLLGGSVLSFSEFGFSGGLVATTAAAVVGGGVFIWEFVYLPKTKLIKKLSMSGTIAGRTQPELAEKTIIGQEGTTETVLNPSGYIRLNDQRFEAFSQRGQIEPDTPVRVVGLDNFRIIVTPKPEDS